MTERFTGGCLCGTVAFEVSGPFSAFHWCHCSRCRKDTGSAHAANLFTRPDAIHWRAGEEAVRRFELPEAGQFAKAFCSHCGSPAPYINRSGTHLVVPAGCLDVDPGMIPQDNIHWDSRASWYEAGICAPRYGDEPPE